MTVSLGDEAVEAYRIQTVWQEPFERDIAPLYQIADGILDIFEQTIASNALGGIVVSHRGTSAVVARKHAEGFRCRLAFIDGDHSFEAVCRDIDNIEPILLPGGWLCFDDAFTSYDGVDRAIRERVAENSAYDLKQQLTRKLFVAEGGPSSGRRACMKVGVIQSCYLPWRGYFDFIG